MPPILSAICLAILAQKANSVRRERELRVIAGVVPRRQAILAMMKKGPVVPPEVVVVAGHLLQGWAVGGSIPINIGPLGEKLSSVPGLDSFKGTTSSLLLDEADQDFLERLNECYPPLIDVTGEGSTSFDEVAVASALEGIAKKKAEMEERDLNITLVAPPPIAKTLLSDLNDTANTLASTAVTLASRWLSTASSFKALLPTELQNEIGFLIQYIRLCMEADTALDLPLLFPEDYEADSLGAIVRLKRPAYVFVLRAVARAVAGAVVALMPYVGKTGPKAQAQKTLEGSQEEEDEGLDDEEDDFDYEEAIRSGGLPTTVPLKIDVTSDSVHRLAALRLQPEEPVAPPARNCDSPTPSELGRAVAAGTLPSPPPSEASRPDTPVAGPLSANPIDFGGWDAFRVFNAGIPEELLKVEYEMMLDGEEGEFDEDGVDAW
ncbi:hypothetical protein HK104_001910 [Borealophlyctis nickersoniae]|nr:hypothetical protein HK104_001910 [Borealophlyctis nickersoniae]